LLLLSLLVLSAAGLGTYFVVKPKANNPPIPVPVPISNPCLGKQGLAYDVKNDSCVKINDIFDQHAVFLAQQDPSEFIFTGSLKDELNCFGDRFKTPYSEGLV